MNKLRKSLLAIVPAAGAAMLAGRDAGAQSAGIDEKEGTATAPGYKHDAAALDGQKKTQ